MAVRVDIFNSTLGHIGSGAVLTDPGEDGAHARELRRHYPSAWTTLLAEFPYQFARRVTPATPIAAPPPGAAYAYQMPAGCAELRKVAQTADDEAEPLDFRIGGVTGADGADTTVILTQQPALFVTWTRLVANEALWPAHFTLAVSWRLAALAGSAIVRDNFRRQECWQQAVYWQRQAEAQDQRQGRATPREAEAIRGRV